MLEFADCVALLTVGGLKAVAAARLWLLQAELHSTQDRMRDRF